MDKYFDAGDVDESWKIRDEGCALEGAGLDMLDWMQESERDGEDGLAYLAQVHGIYYWSTHPEYANEIAWLRLKQMGGLKELCAGI